MDDVAAGFRMFGQLERGECWPETESWVLPLPLSQAEFLSKNLEYVQDSFRMRRLDILLQGVFKEREEFFWGGDFCCPSFCIGDLKRPQPRRSPSSPRVRKEKSRFAVVKIGGGLFTMPRRGVARTIALSMA